MKYLLLLILLLPAWAAETPHVDRWVPTPETVNVVIEGKNPHLSPPLFAAQLRMMFQRWHIKIKVRTTPAPPPGHKCRTARDETCIHVYANMVVYSPGSGFGYGVVPGIDEGNLKDEHLCSPVIGGVFVGSIQKRWERDNPKRPIGQTFLSITAAKVTGHEIGHLLGAWHVHTDRPYYMAIGPVGISARDRWAPATTLLFDRTLGRRKGGGVVRLPLARRILKIPGR